MELERQEAEGRVSGFSGFDADADNVALFVQDRFEWRDRFSGTAGARWDRQDPFGTEGTWRLSGTWVPGGTGTRFLASVGTGFKAPSLAERFDASFGSENPDLEPEESFGLDAGVTRSWRSDRIRAGATLFFNDIDDMIVAVFDGVAFRNVNVEKVETKGVETFVEFHPAPRWSSRLNYTRTDTEAVRAASFGLTDGSALLRRPEDEAGADLTHLFPGGRGQTTLSVLYVGERLDLDPVSFATVTAGDYLVVNLSGSVRVGGPVELFARVDNLLDEEYQEVLGFNAPGLGAYAGLRIGL